MLSFPLIEEIPFVEPVALFAILPSDGAIFLDSASIQNQGRYSFIGYDPFQIMTCKNGVLNINKIFIADNPFSILEKELAKYSLPLLTDLPPFQGGVAGMFGYELGRYLEKIPLAKKEDFHFPEMILGFYDLVIALDHYLKKAWVFSSGFPEKDLKKRLSRAQKRLNWVLDKISSVEKLPACTMNSMIKISSNFTKKTYEAAVLKVKEYIRAGDIFEANISQRFHVSYSTFDPFQLYRNLRLINPAPFACFFKWGDLAIASASPERFLQLRGSLVQTRPIKGTSKRDPDKIKDAILAKQLFESEKERAENIMIVDLMRNDLSRVCMPHTVLVPQLCELESFASVHHLVSVVEGRLMPQKNALDLIRATFPGGSVTGAPKIRSMEIIAEIEPITRGPYCGSLGYIGFNGEMDLSITIRTFVIYQNRVSFHAGGAITLDSCPSMEYQETLLKAERLASALRENDNKYIFN